MLDCPLMPDLLCFRSADDDQDIIFLLKQLEKSLMDSLVLRGIEGIKNAFIPARESRPYIERVADDGGLAAKLFQAGCIFCSCQTKLKPAFIMDAK